MQTSILYVKAQQQRLPWCRERLLATIKKSEGPYQPAGEDKRDSYIRTSPKILDGDDCSEFPVLDSWIDSTRAPTYVSRWATYGQYMSHFSPLIRLVGISYNLLSKSYVYTIDT